MSATPHAEYHGVFERVHHRVNLARMLLFRLFRWCIRKNSGCLEDSKIRAPGAS